MAKNRLEIILSANTGKLKSDLRSLDAAVSQTGSNINQSFSSSTEGLSSLEQVVRDTADEFSGISGSASTELSKVEKASVQAGAALEKSFDGVDAKGAAQEVNFLERALEKAGYTTGALDKVADSLDDIKDKADDAGDGLEKAFQAQALGEFAGKVSAAGKNIGGFFEDAAADARNIDREIRKTFSDPKDIKNFSKIVGNIKAEFGDLANSEGLTKALQKLESGGIANEKELRRVINIAEATGKSYDEVAEKQAEFFSNASGGTVNVQVLNEYRKTIGAGAKDLEKYGVKVDENNNLIAKTPAEIKKAQDALRKYLDENERFNGVLERAQDNTDKFEAQVGFLNESLGVQVNEFKNVVAGGLLPFVKGLNNSSDGLKKFVGLSIAGGSAIAEYGGKTVEFVAHAKAAGLSVAGLTGGIQKATLAVRAFVVSTAGMAAGLAIAAAGLVLITKSALDYTESLEQAEKAEQKLQNTQSRALNKSKDRIASINKTVDALQKEYAAIEDFGERRSTIAKDILVKENALQKARDENDRKRAGQLEFEIRKLRSVRSEYDLQAATVAAVEKKKEEAQSKGLQAFLKGEEERKKKREEQAALDKAAAEKRIELDKADPDGADKIAEQAAERTRQLNVQISAEKAKLDRENAAKQADLDSKRSELQKKKAKEVADQESKLTDLALERFKVEQAGADQVFESRRKQLDEEERRGADVAQQRLDLEKEIQDANKARLQEQLKLELDVITARNNAANQGATKEQQTINNAKAELDTAKAKQRTQEQTNKLNDDELAKARDLTAEIQRQIDAKKDLNKEIQKGFSLGGSFGNLTGLEDINAFDQSFGQSSQKNQKDPSAPTEAELQADLARAKVAEIEAAEKARGKSPKAGGESNPVQQVSRGDAGQSAAAALSTGSSDSAAAALAQTGQQSLAAQQQSNQLLQQLIAAVNQSAQSNSQRTANFGDNFGRTTEDTFR